MLVLVVVQRSRPRTLRILNLTHMLPPSSHGGLAFGDLEARRVKVGSGVERVLWSVRRARWYVTSLYNIPMSF